MYIYVINLYFFLGFIKSWRNPSVDVQKVPEVPENDNEGIEMASLQEQPAESQEDGVIEDQRLLSIICKPRKENTIITKREVKYLRSMYKKHHPMKIECFYQYVHDFADYKSLELIMDQFWNFERELHKTSDLEANTHVVQAWKSDSTSSIANSLNDEFITEAWNFDKDHYLLTDFDAITCLSENIKEPTLLSWTNQNMAEERGPGYNLGKTWNLKICKPLKKLFHVSFIINSCSSFYKCLMLTKSLLIGLFFSFSCFIDSFKDLILASILWHFSEKILVCI